MRKALIISAAAIAASLSLATVAANYATAGTVDVLTYGSQGGTNVAVGNVISDPIAPGTVLTFYTTTTGTTGGSCSTGSTSATVATNPAVGGVADLSNTVESLSNCTDNLTFKVNSVSISNPSGATFSASGVAVPSVTGIVSGTEEFGVALSCKYTGTNLVSGFSFTNQQLNRASGQSTQCPATLYVSGQAGTLVDTSVSGDPIVYLNVP
jgi:hypothetical protein